ncbi:MULTISPECIES: nicotinate (nicotinamide) nucleotide adenylyltransferase [Campylobacter]|uniref:nicotinate (nicotinamide) nucleotide adenylyltransferase n=1 Tax=Campylobacter TaxID=194 RepID=UPI00138E3328|nr:MULTISPECIES: nicotinate (nicotinamide) nucleotide adenylyltransferase [Campylobacter]MDV2490879.1 nicotinate (nicotinamide) nucleotide adenylyltransferase [Campylobacter sp. TJR-1]
MNIAIFGGSFDPPHNAHDAIVKAALLNLKIDKLIIIPTYLNPFKTEFGADPKKRLVWCEALWQNLDKVEISKFEIEQNRAVPSLESVLHFKKIYNPDIFYLIIGADQLINLEKWYKFKVLKKLVNFVVASRDDIEIPSNLQKLNINVKISSTKVRNELDFCQVPKAVLEDVIKFYKEKNAR